MEMMEVEENKKPLVPKDAKMKLRLYSPNEEKPTFTITADILVHFELFVNAYHDIEKDKEGFLIFEELEKYKLGVTFWGFILTAYKEYNIISSVEVKPPSKKETFLSVAQRKGLNAIQMTNLFQIARTLDYYGAPLLLDAVLMTIVDRIKEYSANELYLMSPEMQETRLLDGGDTIKRNLSEPLEIIAGFYYAHQELLQRVIAYYTESFSITAHLKESFFPKATSVIATGGRFVAVMAQDGLYIAGESLSKIVGSINDNTTYPSKWHRMLLGNVISVWANQSIMMVLTMGGVVVFGRVGFKQIGKGKEHKRLLKENPNATLETKVNISNVLSVACSDDFSIFRTRHGVYGTPQAPNIKKTGMPVNYKEKEVPFAASEESRIYNGATREIASGDTFVVILEMSGTVKMYGFIMGLHMVGLTGVVPNAVSLKTKFFKDAENTSSIVFPEGAARIVSIAAGSHHALFLDKNGRVYALGKNASGSLGIEDPLHMSREEPTLIQSLVENRIVYISASNTCSFFIDDIGDAYRCGFRAQGIDHRSHLLYDKPVKVQNISRCISVSSHNNDIWFVTCDGLYCQKDSEDQPTKQTLVISKEPLCKRTMPVDIVEGTDDNAPEPDTKKKKTDACHFCGSMNIEQLGFHRPTQRVQCLDASYCRHPLLL